MRYIRVRDGLQDVIQNPVSLWDHIQRVRGIDSNDLVKDWWVDHSLEQLIMNTDDVWDAPAHLSPHVFVLRTQQLGEAKEDVREQRVDDFEGVVVGAQVA